RTERIRPTVMTAPTMMRNCSIPGSPVPFGSISIIGVLLLLTTPEMADLPARCTTKPLDRLEWSQADLRCLHIGIRRSGARGESCSCGCRYSGHEEWPVPHGDMYCRPWHAAGRMRSGF